MALLKYSGLISANAGKLNGSTFQTCPGSNVIKSNDLKRSKVSKRQAQVRKNYQTLVKSYSNLNQADKDSWVNQALIENWSNKVGEEFHPTGQLLYLSNNMRLLQAGINAINILPPKPLNIYLSNTSLSTYLEGDTQMIIDFTGQTISSNLCYKIEATPGLSQSISNVNGSYKTIDYISPGTVNNYEFFFNYWQVFGYPVENTVIWFRLTPIDITTGFIGHKIYFHSIVQPIPFFTFPGYIAGFRANKNLTISSGEVTNWADYTGISKSLSYHFVNLNPKINYYGLANKPAVEFSNLQALNAIDLLPMNQPFTVMVILSAKDYAHNATILKNKIGSGNSFKFILNGLAISVAAGGFLQGSLSMSSQGHALTLIVDSTNSKICDATDIIVSGDAGSDNFSSLVIGDDQGNWSDTKLNISEIYFFAGALDLSYVTLLCQYAFMHYNLGYN